MGPSAVQVVANSWRFRSQSSMHALPNSDDGELVSRRIQGRPALSHRAGGFHPKLALTQDSGTRPAISSDCPGADGAREGVLDHARPAPAGAAPGLRWQELSHASVRGAYGAGPYFGLKAAADWLPPRAWFAF